MIWHLSNRDITSDTAMIQNIITLTMRALRQFTLVVLLAVAPFAHAAETQTVLMLGDSLTAGYGLGPGDGLVDQLQERADDTGLSVRFINAGVSGDTTKGGLARLDWALAEGVDKAVVALGGNDMLRGLSPADSFQNLRGILQRLQQDDIEILLAGMLAPANMGAEYQADFDALYPALAEEFDIIYMPFFLQDVALVPALNQSDGLHPNRAGVSVMVDNLMPYIETLLAKPN